jgi:nucleoside-diphosphate-sugar epimerase
MGNPSEDQVVKPAVEGTLNVLEACLKHQVKKVVVTSSVAAVWYGNWDKVVNEDDWSIETACGSYEKSKLRAERLVWDFWRKHKGKLEIATICPGFIVGPCYTLGGGASEEMVTELMLNKVPGIPKLGFGVVDVRDVAFAHIKAMEIPNNDG